MIDYISLYFIIFHCISLYFTIFHYISMYFHTYIYMYMFSHVPAYFHMLSPHGSTISPLSKGDWRRCCRAVLALHLAAAADESPAAKAAAGAGGDGRWPKRWMFDELTNGIL